MLGFQDPKFIAMFQDYELQLPSLGRRNSNKLHEETELLNYVIEEILFQESDSQIVHFVEGRKIRSVDQLVGIANKCNNYEHIYFLDGEQLTPMFPQFVGCLMQFKHYKHYLDSQEKQGKFQDWKSLTNDDFVFSS